SNSGVRGAYDRPSAPSNSVVTPWRTFEGSPGLASSGRSEWAWTSMKPGARTSPLASTTRSAAAEPRSPTAAIRSPSIPTSAAWAGLPEPSTTCAARNSSEKSVIRSSAAAAILQDQPAICLSGFAIILADADHGSGRFGAAAATWQKQPALHLSALAIILADADHGSGRFGAAAARLGDQPAICLSGFAILLARGRNRHAGAKNFARWPGAAERPSSLLQPHTMKVKV